MKGTIVAIGGGNTPAGDTIKIDKGLIRMSGKKHPRLLFISTASDSEPRYSDSMMSHFTSIGCECSHLSLILDSYPAERIRDMIVFSDIIYVGGGDSIRLVHVLRSTGTDAYLREAYERGALLAGVSAGAMIWFSYGHTDSLSYYTKDWHYSRLACLGFVRAFLCPHCAGERRREFESLYAQGESFPGIALENRTALVWRDGVGTLIRENPEVNGYIFYPTADGKYKTLIPAKAEKFDL